MHNLYNISILFFSFLTGLFLIFFITEILIRIILFLRDKIFYQNIKRKDFINKDYHDYLNWIEAPSTLKEQLRIVIIPSSENILYSDLNSVAQHKPIAIASTELIP